MSLGGKRDTRKVRARENYRKRGRDLGLHAAARVNKGENERAQMEKGRRRAKERRRSYTHTRACPILFATVSERAATTCCAVATANTARLTWRGQGHHCICVFRLQRKRPPQHQRHPYPQQSGRAESFFGTFYSGAQTNWPQRIHLLPQGLSSNLDSLWQPWIHHLAWSRKSPETEHEGRLRCLCSPATDCRWPCPRNSTTARRHVASLLCWQLLQGRNSQHPTLFASWDVAQQRDNTSSVRFKIFGRRLSETTLLWKFVQNSWSRNVFWTSSGTRH